jgi:hypothetical protein
VPYIGLQDNATVPHVGLQENAILPYIGRIVPYIGLQDNTIAFYRYYVEGAEESVWA